MKRKWEEKVKQVEELASQYERKPLIPVYKPKLYKTWQPASIWKLFYRQTHAFNFAKSCKEDVHVFALERENQDIGQRIYLVTTYAELWFYYHKHRKTLMHCYEIIPENSVCKLYFDLEFYKPANPEADGKKMVAQLIAYIRKKLEELYGIKCSAEDVLNLDSSTEKKFSRHLIFLLQNAAFKDNIHAGVYTKNRNFRLYKSSKLGNDVCLEVAEDNTFVPKAPKNISVEEHIFLSSLVSNVRFSDTLKILTCDVPDHRVTRCPDQQHPITSVEAIAGYKSSPYPEIDSFILSLVNKPGVQGGIRHWNYFFLEELLVYDISKYHWCENIGRAHKSNHIMLLVDLKREVWYQKCHDPVCRAQNFKSNYVPLPPEVCLPSLFKEDEENVLFMDEDGNIEESKPKICYNSIQLQENKLGLEGSKEGINSTCPSLENEDDDTCFLEAAEDAELVEAVDNEIAKWNCELEEIPDELLLEALQEQVF